MFRRSPLLMQMGGRKKPMTSLPTTPSSMAACLSLSKNSSMIFVSDWANYLLAISAAAFGLMSACFVGMSLQAPPEQAIFADSEQLPFASAVALALAAQQGA